MDSHEEKVYLAVRQMQEREAKQKMREKAKELQRQRLEANKRGVSLGRGSSSASSFSSGISSGGISSSSVLSQSSVGIGEAASSPIKWVTQSKLTSVLIFQVQIKTEIDLIVFRKAAPTRIALKLGDKSKDVDSFVDQL